MVIKFLARLDFCFSFLCGQQLVDLQFNSIFSLCRARSINLCFSNNGLPAKQAVWASPRADMLGNVGSPALHPPHPTPPQPRLAEPGSAFQQDHHSSITGNSWTEEAGRLVLGAAKNQTQLGV